MSRIPFEDQAQNKSISIRPIKILEPFESAMDEEMKFLLSEGVSTLMLYFIKNRKNKKLKEELKKIKREIEERKVNVRPSF